jgi:hypothetical protein
VLSVNLVESETSNTVSDKWASHPVSFAFTMAAKNGKFDESYIKHGIAFTKMTALCTLNANNNNNNNLIFINGIF